DRAPLPRRVARTARGPSRPMDAGLATDPDRGGHLRLPLPARPRAHPPTWRGVEQPGATPGGGDVAAPGSVGGARGAAASSGLRPRLLDRWARGNRKAAGPGDRA